MGHQLSKFTYMPYLPKYNADFIPYKYFLKIDHSLHLCIFKSVRQVTRNYRQKSHSLFIYV